MADPIKAPKDVTALPMQRMYVHFDVKKRAKVAKTEEELAAIAARAAAGKPDPGDEDDDEDDVYDVSLSSDTTIDRGWYMETLDHSKDAINLDRAANGMNLLFNHDTDQPHGRLENLKPKSGKLTAKMRFFSTADSQNLKTKVDEGMREMSIGYSIQTYEYTPGAGGAADSYRATSWTPLEASIVSVPADYSVGVGRAQSDDVKYPVLVRNTSPPPAVIHQEPKMTETERAAADAAAQAKAKLPAEIAQLARKHGMADKTAEWLEAGHSLEKVREIILEAKGTREETVTTGGPAGGGVDLSSKEQREYSYARAINAAVEQMENKRAVVKCLETEVSDALERQMPGSYKRRGGLYIPMSLRTSGIKEYAPHQGRMSSTQRAVIEMALRAGVIDSQTVNALKEVVFTEYGGELIEILRNQAMVVAMGARTLTGLSSPIAFPRQLTDSIAQWIAENPTAGALAGSNPTTDLVTLAPHTLMSSSAYSRQLLVQSSIDVEAFVRSSIGAAHALALDLAAIHGTGLNSQPLGIYNQVGVGTTDFTAGTGGPFGNAGNTISYAGCINMEVKVANANALLGTLGYMTTPSIAGDAKNTLKFPGAAIAQGGPLWEGQLQNGQLNGYRAVATNQVSKTMGANGAASGGTNHGFIYGNWADVLIGLFGGAMEMIVDPYSLKKQGLIEVTSFQMADVAIRHPGSFVVGTNLAA
jgi:HK97 family phage major capsid protein